MMSPHLEFVFYGCREVKKDQEVLVFSFQPDCVFSHLSSACVELQPRNRRAAETSSHHHANETKGNTVNEDDDLLLKILARLAFIPL